MNFPEEVGVYCIYDPTSTGGGWAIARDDLWLPVICTDREACQAIMDLDDHPDWWDVMGELEQLGKTSGHLSADDIRQHVQNRDSRQEQQ